MNHNHKGRKLGEIAADLEMLSHECKTWFLDNIADRLAVCKSFADVHVIRSELSQTCMSGDRQVLEVPFEIMLPLLSKCSEFLDKPNTEKVEDV